MRPQCLYWIGFRMKKECVTILVPLKTMVVSPSIFLYLSSGKFCVWYYAVTTRGLKCCMQLLINVC
jgi:hypothetical protein